MREDVTDREILVAVLLAGSIAQACQRLGLHYRFVRACLDSHCVVTEQGCRPDRSLLLEAIDRLGGPTSTEPPLRLRLVPLRPTLAYPAASIFRCDNCGRRTSAPVCPCGHVINPVLAREAGAA